MLEIKENPMQPRTIAQHCSVFVMGILLCISTQAATQAGQLDKTFADHGIFADPLAKSTANAVAVQSDGKIVLAGIGVNGNSFADTLIRLNTDGTLDTSFGTGGVDDLNPPQGASFGFFAVAIQPDGKIVAAAAAQQQGSSVVVARVETNGSLDTTFGSGGFTATVSTGGFTFFDGGLALQADGKILVAAGFGNPSIMTRFTAAGQIDTGFGKAGIVNLENPGPTQLAVQSNGKILVASGEAARLISRPLPAAQAGTIARYNSNGTLDKTFGVSGVVGSVASASALLLQSDGKIVIAGAITSKLNAPQTASDVGFGLVRYDSNGSVDSSFGNGGVAITDFGVKAPATGAFAVAIQANGDIVAAGAAGMLTGGQLSASSLGLARYTSAGTLDTSFGTGGKVLTPISGSPIAWVTGLAIQSDGKILATGVAEQNFEFGNRVVARYLAQ
jgi:uncharacterized delta-60 repeat protein